MRSDKDACMLIWLYGHVVSQEELDEIKAEHKKLSMIPISAEEIEEFERQSGHLPFELRFRRFDI